MDALHIVLLIAVGLLAALSLLLYLRATRTAAEMTRASKGRAEAWSALAADREELTRWHDYLDALGDATPDALLLLDSARRVTWSNGVAREMFVTKDGHVGQTFIGLVHDYELNQAVVDAIGGNRSIVRQTAVESRTLRISAAPVAGGEGTAVSIEDVTELQRLGRARRDFVANLSHELRTPLANIDLAAQTLRNGAAADAALSRRMLDQIQVQVQALSQMSEEMLELAQIESGQVLLKLVPAKIGPLVERSVTYLLPQASLKSQHISIMIAEGLTALVDEHQISRVISNLVHNAVKFTPEGGIISISAEAIDADDVRVCVSDTGPGVPESDFTRIFERFYKHDRARTKGGTGLGLAIARHIVEGHGGRIWVESVPGHGASFFFTVPRA